MLTIVYREENRQHEIRELVKQGKRPHEVELEKHPEKSLSGRSWLMGKVAGAIEVRYPFVVTIVIVLRLKRMLNLLRKCEYQCLLYFMLLVLTLCLPSVDELVRTAAINLQQASSLIETKARL